MELRATFVYQGGETWQFVGDDDLWVFIGGRLVVDVGGLHTPEQGLLTLGDVGLTVGTQYDMAVFHAERHSPGSNFQLTTNIAFTNCEPVIRDVVR